MRPYEFWNPRFFEAPYYLYLVFQCALRGLPIKNLAKANYALDHGELGLGSKFTTQMAFSQERFLPTILIDPDDGVTHNYRITKRFGSEHSYPVILKPDIGAVGKGVIKIHSDDEFAQILPALKAPHLVQKFSASPAEFGVFFIRRGGKNQISGINKKHFPSVVGNGRDSILELAKRHYRFTDHWNIFLKYVDTDRVLADGEVLQLSFIGSHTMGCKFTDDTDLCTPELEKSVYEVCDSQPGFNFGRLDVRSESVEAFQAGEFVVIEINGVASLPTHMFDPENSLARAYRVFLSHGRYLAQIASEHRNKPMALDSYGDIWRLAKKNHTLLNSIHRDALSLPPS